MNPFKKFSLLETIIAVALLALLAAIVLPRRAQAQPYVTNPAAPYFGAPQYNSAYPSPLKPAQTLNNQYNAGILAGNLAAIALTNANAGTFSNTVSFGTNIYSSPPIMLYTLVGLSTNQVVASAVTPTNFVVMITGTNNVGIINWAAIGH